MNSYFALLPVISAILCVALGLFTLSRNYRHPANIGFTFGLFSLAVIEIGNALVLSQDISHVDALKGIRLALSGEAVLPVAWYVFAITFARANYMEVLFRWVPALVVMAILSLVFILNTDSPAFISAPVEGLDLDFFFMGPMGRYFYIYLIVTIVMSMVQLENTFRSSSGVQRWRVKYVIFGVGAILAFYIYKASQALLFSSINAQIIPVISAVTFISVSMMALFIVRHRLLEVNIFISRYVVYNSLTILIIGLYLLAVGVVTQGITYFNIPFSYFFSALFIFGALLALFVILFNASLRRKAQLFINRHFYEHKYEFRDKWMESIEKISPKSSVDEIVKTLIEMITETMGAKPVYLWLYDPVSRNYLLSNSENIEKSKVVEVGHPVLKIMEKFKGPIIIEDVYDNETEDIVIAIEDLATEAEAVLCSPLFAGEEIVGFILLGKDISGENYRQDDFEFLKAVTTQGAVQIKNIRLADDLITAKEVDMFSKMSSFIMHDLKNLTNSLSLVSQNAKRNMGNPEFQKDAMLTIEKTVLRMKGLIEKLSAVRNGLELNKEAVSLSGLVELAIKKVAFSKDKDVIITKKISGSLMIDVDSDAMEMVFINLIANAIEAINLKGVIDITADIDGRNVRINFSDTGKGMSREYIGGSLFKPFRSTKKTGFGIGLYQCKAIVEAHGGALGVTSSEGKGTTFTLRLPVYQPANVGN